MTNQPSVSARGVMPCPTRAQPISLPECRSARPRRAARNALLFASMAFSALLAAQHTDAGILDPAPAYPASAYPPSNYPASPNPPSIYSRFPQSAYDWTGLYIGINGGTSWARAGWDSGPDAKSGTARFAGSQVGGTVGYNAQTIGSFVYSAEFDFDWRRMNVPLTPASCAPNCELKSSWISTARLRFGYTIDRFLPYVTGGVSMSDFRTDIVDQPIGTQHSLNFGLTAGGGVELVLSGPLTAKVEYLYVNHSSIACADACGGGPIAIRPSENIVRAGINYRIWQK